MARTEVSELLHEVFKKLRIFNQQENLNNSVVRVCVREREYFGIINLMG